MPFYIGGSGPQFKLIDTQKEVMLMKDFDVIIIGAGPAGSTAAKEIAKKGWDTLLIEKNIKPGLKNACGGDIILNADLHLDINENIIERKIHRETYYFPWGIEQRNGQHIQVQREKFDNYLYEQAIKAGAESYLKTKVIDVERIETGDVKVVIKHNERNEIQKIYGKLIVFADGPHTLSQKLFNIGFKKKKNNTAFALSYDLEWTEDNMNHLEVYYGPDIAKWGFGWIFPKKEVLNVGLGCILSELNKRKNMKEILEYFINRHPIASERLRGRKILKMRGGVIPMGAAKKNFSNSVLVVGDAAGMANPLFGSGIDNAIIAAEILAKIVNQSLLDNNFSESFLQKYQSEWQNNKRFKIIIFQEILANAGFSLLKIDKYILGKMIHLLFMRDNLNYSQKLRILFYQFSGKHLLKHPSTIR